MQNPPSAEATKTISGGQGPSCAGEFGPSRLSLALMPMVVRIIAETVTMISFLPNQDFFCFFFF
jgi:hypothetical protein